MALLNKWDRQHLKNEGRYARQIEAIYQAAVREAAAIGALLPNFSPDKPFSFADYPSTKARIDKLLSGLKSSVTTVILDGINTEWTLANDKNSELCDTVFGKNAGKLTKEQQRRYYSPNDAARKAFSERKTAGLNLSDRVWRYTGQFKTEIEMGIDLGLRDGLSADEMSRQLRQYLQQPDKLFRRVRDEHGQLHLSKRAAAYHPGAGVYRSSYKNARRLAATETNLAYRTSDYTRWQQLDFVVGIEIKLSNNHTLNGVAFTDICDQLAGRYPKDFKFTGWHPHCRCYAVSILKTEEEMAADNERIMNGETPDGESVNKVSDVPDNFKAWIADNEERIARANDRGTLTYFLKDNRGLWADLSSVDIINRHVIDKTKGYGEAFGATSTVLARSLGVRVTPVNLKSEARILEKARKDYHGDVFEVNDIIRNTFIAPADKIPMLIAEIEKRFNKIEFKPQSSPDGYTGYLLKIWVRDGVKGEIQVNTPQMIYAKEVNANDILGADLFNKIKGKSGLPHGLGHKYYEEYRILSEAEKQSAKGRKLAEKSREYYESIRRIKL